MYILQFNKNRSKNFPEALSFAKELGGTFDGKRVTIEINEHDLFIAYSTFRTLFGIIQNWVSTKATFRGKEVHPYRFILKMHELGLCQLKKDCGHTWGCNKLNVISYEELGTGNYKANGRYWYNYGSFKGGKWIIDKASILEKLVKQRERLGLDICPLYDEMKLIFTIENLPNYIELDNVKFKYSYIERYVNGQKIFIRDNMRHVTKHNNKQPSICPVDFRENLKRIK